MEDRRHHARRAQDRQRANRPPERRGGQAETEDPARTKRRAIRHHCDVSFDTHIARAVHGSDDFALVPDRVKGRVLDLSADGMLFYSPRALSMNEELALSLTIGDGRTVKVRGEVRWIKSMQKRDGYGVGVKFRSLDEGDEARILEYLDELDETLGL